MTREEIIERITSKPGWWHRNSFDIQSELLELGAEYLLEEIDKLKIAEGDRVLGPRPPADNTRLKVH